MFTQRLSYFMKLSHVSQYKQTAT